MSVQPFASASSVHPGQTATYVVWVWSAHASSKDVTVSAAVGNVKGVGTPRFSVCPHATGAKCALGGLPQDQADELQVRVVVHKSAATGHKLALTATAQAKHAKSFSGAASIKIVAVPAPAPSTSPPSDPGDPGASIPALPPTLPTVPSAIPGWGADTNPGGLFPTVSPHPSPSSSPAAHGRRATRIRATNAGDTLPLDPRLIGGQLAGLVVLAAAIAIALARLSFRPQRPSSSDDDKRT